MVKIGHFWPILGPKIFSALEKMSNTQSCKQTPPLRFPLPQLQSSPPPPPGRGGGTANPKQRPEIFLPTFVLKFLEKIQIKAQNPDFCWDTCVSREQVSWSGIIRAISCLFGLGPLVCAPTVACLRTHNSPQVIAAPPPPAAFKGWNSFSLRPLKDAKVPVWVPNSVKDFTIAMHSFCCFWGIGGGPEMLKIDFPQMSTCSCREKWNLPSICPVDFFC